MVRGTTAYKRYYRPPARYYRCGAGSGGYIGAGGGFFSPIPIRSPPRSASSLQQLLAAGGLRRISFSGASLSIPFSGIDPHLVLLPWMPVLPPFLLSFCLVFQILFLGAMVVASLDFWLNLGLSRMEKATRRFGLVIGRSIFEFGRTVVPDLTTVVGNCCFPVSSGTIAPLEWYYRLERYCRLQVAVLPLATQFHRTLTIQ